MLNASHLRKEFTTVVAVDDVTFSVSRGQVFGLIGPNGAGKSTTIRMIMDIIEPDRGVITIDGRPAGAASRNIVGYLPEERGLYRKNTLGNVIAYFGALKGLSAAAARAAAAPWLERFQLAGALKRNVEELSKGNQQKVQFIISVLHDPKLLVLDEVFSGLDPVNQVLLREALQQLRARNTAIVFSTHQMEYAEKLCDDLILIDRGRVVLEGAPSSIKQRFGKNTVQIAYDGDGEFLRALPGVARAAVSQHYAELVLDDGADTGALLRDAAARLSVSRFERIEPSLESIFIDTVGMPEPDTPATERPAAAPRLVSKDPKVRRALFLMMMTGMLFVVFSAALARRNGLWSGWLLAYAGMFLASILMYVKRRNEARKRIGADGAGGDRP